MQTSKRQRLAIYLDGTWNTEDDSTNVLNAYHSTVEGLVQETNKEDFIQKRYYDRGVGTGMFESIRGGGYGKGLEKIGQVDLENARSDTKKVSHRNRSGDAHALR